MTKSKKFEFSSNPKPKTYYGYTFSTNIGVDFMDEDANGDQQATNEVYNNPYDAIKDRMGTDLDINPNLCIMENDKIIMVLPTKMICVRWALACASRALLIFEKTYPYEYKPRRALKILKYWIDNNGNEATRIYLNKNYNIIINVIDNLLEKVDDYGDDFVFDALESVKYAIKTLSSSTDDIQFKGDLAPYATNALFSSQCAVEASENESLEKNWQRTELLRIVNGYIFPVDAVLRNFPLPHDTLGRVKQYTQKNYINKII